MPWDYSSAEAITERISQSVNVDRLNCQSLVIDFANKTLRLTLDRGVSDGNPGGGQTKKDEIVYSVTDATRFDAIVAIVTQASNFTDEIERILFAEARTDGAIPAGSVS